MDKKVIIADAGPLIAFGKIKKIKLISEVLGKIITTDFVLKECLSNPAQEGAKEIADALKTNLIIPHETPEISQQSDLFSILGRGEASAIVLASELQTGLLIDEKLGRRIAQKMNIPIIGTAGVLLLAKEKKLIKKITPIMLELKNKGYYLSEELMRKVLILAKEKSF